MATGEWSSKKRPIFGGLAPPDKTNRVDVRASRICNLSFSRNDSLARHNKDLHSTHLDGGVKPYACWICFQSGVFDYFASVRKDKLVDHLMQGKHKYSRDHAKQLVAMWYP